LEAGDMSMRKLRSKGSNPGLVDLILMKKGIKDFFVSRFLDLRNINSDHKHAIRDMFQNPDTYKIRFGGDLTEFSSWPQSASKTVDMIEATCFLLAGHDDNTIKIGIKVGKTAQEIVEEYQPWKAQIEEIDAALKSENSTMKVVDDDTDPKQIPAAAPSASSSVPGAAATTVVPPFKVIGLSPVEDKWTDYARRHIGKFCVLLVEAGMSQTQLQTALSNVSLGIVKGGPSGNVIITFDANLFGESITAPHVRKPPLQAPIVNKMWKAISAARALPDQNGLVPVGDVLVIIDGGRKSDMFLNHFGMGKDRKNSDKTRKLRDGKTICREVIINLEEKSVKARKHRKKSRHDFVTCTQKAYIVHNAQTQVNLREHKHFPHSSNMSNTLGPVTLPSWQSSTKLSIKDKKEFWGARRRAVGGRSDAGDGSDESEEESEPEEGEPNEMIDLPDVGGGRGSKTLPESTLQPVSYHALPRIVTDSLHHAMWGLSTIDMTPCIGDLACDNVTANVGYLGICHTEFQKMLILQLLEAHVLNAMKDPQSKAYHPAYAKECEEFEKSTKKTIATSEPPAKKPKTGELPGAPAEEAAPTAAPTGGLTGALAQMLAAAKAAKE
jgi:hypothetical protein